MCTTVLNAKISEVENKIPDNSNDITTQEFNKLAAENFATTLREVNLVSKTDYDNKLTSLNRRIASNKTKHLEVLKKLDSVITKDCNYIFSRIHFAINDGSQNTFFINQYLIF